nr:hypothetical protein [Tanacetum cinerariifolium]
MKARGTLFMALPNKDQLKFHSYQDAKLLMKAIKKRYGGNKESKKLEIQGEVIKQEDINLNLLRSLPSEWKTHALIWRNKAEIETITLDDLYNNLKIYKPELTGSSSTGQNLQKVAFVSSNSTNSTSSTNEADNTAYGVSTAHIQDIYTKNLQKAEKERDELKLTLEKYQNSSKSLNTLLESQVSDKVKTGLGYKVASLVEKSFVKSSKMLENQDNVKSRSDKEYHTVSPPYIGNYIQPKPDLIFIDKQVESESVDVVSIVSSSVVKTVESKVKTVDKEYKEKGVIDIGCSRHMTRNKCYLTEYEDYDGGFISFGDGKGRISGKGKIKTGTLDFDDVYFYKELKALVIKPHNKTPYELIRGRPPLIDFIKHFGYLVTILNTRDYLGKFDKKANEGFFVGCSEVSKAMRVFNKRTRIVEETLNIRFLENAPNVKGNRSDWLFDIDSLTISINYVPVVTGFQTNGIAGTKDNIVADESQVSDNGRQDDQVTRSKFEGLPQQASQTKHINSTNSFNTISSSVNTAGPSFVNAALPSPINAAGTPATMEEEVDINNVDLSYTIPDAPFTKFLKDHPKDQLIGSIETHVQTRNIRKMNKEHGLISSVQKLRRKNHKDFQNYLFACYLSQMEPKKPVQALKDPSWVEIMHDSLLQFKLLHIWTLVNLPKDKWEISTKWVFRNKNDERGIVIKNKARLVAQGHTQEEDKNTPIEPNKALVKDAEAEDVDVHSYRSMIRSLMYLTTSRPDIIFVVYACARMMIAKDGRCFMDKIVVKTGIHLVLLVESSAAKHKLTTAGYVYASCVKQFWTTAKVKKVNDQEEIQALVDKQKVIFTEESIRRDLKFDDPEGTACLLNDTIFAELARIGAKTSAWNEFSSTMASDIIFLANNQKFNFSKYIFDNMVKHLEGGIKFLMFPRFLQVFQNNQVEGMAKDKEICVISSHTKKIFANMRRQGHGFSGNVTPLFETMMKKMKPKRKQRQEAKVDSPSSEVPVKETILTPSSDPLPSGEDSIQLNELMIFYTSLQQQVLNFKKAKIAQAKEIAKLKKRVMKNNVILHIREVLRESE